MKAKILLSGGIDSMSCVEFYLQEGYDVECLFCDYGQPAAKLEYNAAKCIAEYFNVKFFVLKTNKISVPSFGEIYGRNAFLVLQALCFWGTGSYKIVCGIHGGTAYADCTPAFVNAMNRVIDCYANGTVVLEAPFIRLNKKQITDFCFQRALPIWMTYSCEQGVYPPCGSCSSCLDRKELLHE